jgi:uncharacterized protein YkwD
MPRLKLWLVLTTLLALVAVGLTGGTASAQVSDEAAVIDLINAERRAAGLPEVVSNERLGDAATSYASYMARVSFFSHRGPDGSTLVSRAEAAGYTAWSFLAENLAAGQPTPRRVVDAWMKSPTHRANVLAPEARQIGIGKALNPASRYRVYWAMEMGTKLDGERAW